MASQYRGKNHGAAGIYVIRYKPSGEQYVGQANDIDKRCREHERQLNAGTHHNKRLQILWQNSHKSDFVFEVVLPAPEELSPLELQRWLVKQEREAYRALKDKGLALNQVEPEIVPTDDAVKEYEKELDKKNKQNDKEISEERRFIKKNIADLENKLAPKRQLLSDLVKTHATKTLLIQNSTGWRRIFHGRPDGFDFRGEKRNLTVLEEKIRPLKIEVQKAKTELSNLREKHRRLYHQFSKVLAKKMIRDWRGGWRPLIEPKLIAE